MVMCLAGGGASQALGRVPISGSESTKTLEAVKARRHCAMGHRSGKLNVTLSNTSPRGNTVSEVVTHLDGEGVIGKQQPAGGISHTIQLGSWV